MKPRILLITAAAVAALGGAGAVYADQAKGPNTERHRFDPGRIDANSDGFVSRAEAQAEAERMFTVMDSNADGKIDAADRSGREVRIIRREIRGGESPDVEADVRIERLAPLPPGADGQRREIHTEIIREGKEGRRHRGGRHGLRGIGGPMGMMIFAHSGEADTNNDGALSRAEHIAQQLRFYDAADVNGDGKIKFDPPPMMPEPPEAPQPPEAPPAPPPPPAAVRETRRRRPPRARRRRLVSRSIASVKGRPCGVAPFHVESAVQIASTTPNGHAPCRKP